jgi:hypothetical protein
MTVAIQADSKAAVVARLRSFPEIRAFVMTAEGYTADATAAQILRPRISGRVQSFWQLGRWPAPPNTATKNLWSMVVAGPIGNPLDNRDVDGYASRFDLHFYGPNPIEAMRFARQVHPILCPRRSERRPERFVAAGCRITAVDKEGGPFDAIEPDTRFCKAVATYVFTWFEVS